MPFGASTVPPVSGRPTTTAAAAGTPAGSPLALRGIHLHVGSQLGAVDAWRDAVRRGLALLALIGAGREGFDTFDVGGGFPVGDAGTVPTPAHFGREVPPLPQRDWPRSGFSHFSRGHVGPDVECKTCHGNTGLESANTLEAVPIPDDRTAVCRACHLEKQFHWR